MVIKMRRYHMNMVAAIQYLNSSSSSRGGRGEGGGRRRDGQSSVSFEL